MAKASDNVYPKLIIAEGTVPANPSAGQQKLYVDSADHKLKRVNSAGTVTTVEGGSGSTLRFARSRYNAGTIPVTTTSLVVLTNPGGTGGNIEVSITAAAGDLLEIGINAQASNAANTWLDLNVSTFNGATEVNRVGGSGTTGSIASWSVRPNDFFPQSAVTQYVVQAADVVSGSVNLRLLGLVGSGASPRGLFSTSAAPLDFYVKNFGVVGS